MAGIFGSLFKREDQSKLYQPVPRFWQYATSVGGRIVGYGGRTQEFSNSAQNKLKSSIDVYEPYSETWSLQKTTGEPPPGLYDGACTSIGEFLYTYGGTDGSRFYDTLHTLPLYDLRWSQLPYGGVGCIPMKKCAARMVAVDEDKLALFGGYGIPDPHTPGGDVHDGSSFVKDESFADGRGWTNELHVCNLTQDIWSSPTITGIRPPPCAAFTLTSMNKYQSVLFGGRQPEHGRVNDLYVFDFETMECTKIEKQEGEPWPVERSSHAACCLGYCEQYPQLLITGGWGRDEKPLDDTWLWDFSSCKWKQLTLPAGMLPRFRHSATAISLVEGITDVMCYGGCPEWPLNLKKSDDLPRVSETIIMRFERPSTGGKSSVKEWVLADVVSSSQRGTSEKIREKMIRVATKAKETVSHVISPSQHLSIAESESESQQATWRARERAHHVKRSAQTALEEAEQKVLDADARAQEAIIQVQEADKRTQEAEGRAQEAEERLKQVTQQLQEAIRLMREEGQKAQNAEQRAREMQQDNQRLKTQWVVKKNEITFTDEELGRGGWAVVRVAEWRGARLAAKCFYREIVSHYNQGLFNREMNMAARLRHPNLVQFIGASLEGEPVILTELMTTSLRAVLNRGPISHAQSVSISLDIAQALNYLHRMEPDPIIHRDISSANILLDPLPSNRWKAKLSDYGSVNLLQQLQTVGPGSPAYAAPEANNPNEQSPKMDIFSFGVLLIEMLTDQFPEAKARENLITSINHPRFVALVRHCLEDDKDNRPSATELITELNKL